MTSIPKRKRQKVTCDAGRTLPTISGTWVNFVVSPMIANRNPARNIAATAGPRRDVSGLKTWLTSGLSVSEFRCSTVGMKGGRLSVRGSFIIADAIKGIRDYAQALTGQIVRSLLNASSR